MLCDGVVVRLGVCSPNWQLYILRGVGRVNMIRSFNFVGGSESFAALIWFWLQGPADGLRPSELSFVFRGSEDELSL